MERFIDVCLEGIGLTGNLVQLLLREVRPRGYLFQAPLQVCDLLAKGKHRLALVVHQDFYLVRQQGVGFEVGFYGSDNRSPSIDHVGVEVYLSHFACGPRGGAGSSEDSSFRLGGGSCRGSHCCFVSSKWESVLMKSFIRK